MAIVFYAEMLGFFFLLIGIMAAIFCLLGALTNRDIKVFIKVFLALGIMFVVFSLRLHFVPDGEVRSSQYSGIAGLMQIVFFITNSVLLIYFIKTLKQQMCAK